MGEFPQENSKILEQAVDHYFKTKVIQRFFSTLGCLDEHKA